MDPRTEPGMYLVVDMGAGSTELSVNLVREPDADQKILCYADTSFVMGGDNFAEADTLPANERVKKIGQLVKRLVDKFISTYWYGFKKDKNSRIEKRKWSRLRVLLVGGGCRRSEVERALRQNPLYNN